MSASFSRFAIAAVLVALPVAASAAPLRAGAALPAASGATSAATATRAATPAGQRSGLIGFPIAAIVSLFVGGGLVALLTSGNGRSPG